MPLFLLLIVGLPLVESNVTSATNVTKAVPALWTFNVNCHECVAENTFDCSRVRTCPYHVRRCMTVAARVSPRLLIVYKNCTWNCTFVYAAEQPPETPRKRPPRNQFYFANCCNGMNCNSGGPTNIERDIYLPEALEEEILPESAYLGEPEFFLIFASIIFSNIMT
ncbi:glycosyl-phosphatidylinositol-anchored molecule-like protein [Sciurus carolinensis]|uniref:glycosyl-phosphatidylinositol-anchored molecule-like protein n=1 Tax=Sciurus carolinensis TaxID=30640 RepID=UPI001FB3F1AF|nr:glycosyl-phosphatidylinositol-anchored molecule-like protein [Sciurus carolinensis]